jgi:hypothetical protein
MIASALIVNGCFGLPLILGVDGGATLSFADTTIYDSGETVIMANGAAVPLRLPGFGWEAGVYGEVGILKSFSIGQGFGFALWNASSSGDSIKVDFDAWGIGSSTYARYSFPASALGRFSLALGLAGSILPLGLNESFQSGGVSATVTDSGSASITDWTMSMGVLAGIGWESPVLSPNPIGDIGIRCSIDAQYNYGQFGFTDISPAFFPLVLSARAGLEYRYEPTGRLEGPAAAGIPTGKSVGAK